MVRLNVLTNGSSKSCGCLQREVATARRTHGLSKDRRALWLWREYKLTTDEWDALYDKQLGRCAVCLLTLAEAKKVCVDHDHETGKVRGLLCHGCNVGLGHFFDDVASLQRAITYLLEHQPQAEALVTG